MIKLNSAIPLYQQVAEDLKNRIEQGEFCSGQSIPSEAKLCEQYEVSRITIRNAIAELVEQEILVKYQGKGVFVRTPKMTKKLELKDGEKLVYLKRLRHVNDRPVMIEHVYLPYSKYGFLSKIDMENCSLYEKITEKTGLQIEDNCYTSIMLETNITTEEEIVLMGLSEPNAVFVLTETVYLNTGNPLHITKQVLLGDYFKFFMSNKGNQLSMNWKKM